MDQIPHRIHGQWAHAGRRKLFADLPVVLLVRDNTNSGMGMQTRAGQLDVNGAVCGDPSADGWWRTTVAAPADLPATDTYSTTTVLPTIGPPTDGVHALPAVGAAQPVWCCPDRHWLARAVGRGRIDLGFCHVHHGWHVRRRHQLG